MLRAAHRRRWLVAVVLTATIGMGFAGLAVSQTANPSVDEQSIEVAGVVVSSDGMRLAKQRVDLFESEDSYTSALRQWRRQHQQEMPARVPIDSVVTDSLGRYSLTAPRQGLYSVEFRFGGRSETEVALHFTVPVVPQRPPARLQKLGLSPKAKVFVAPFVRDPAGPDEDFRRRVVQLEASPAGGALLLPLPGSGRNPYSLEAERAVSPRRFQTQATMLTPTGEQLLVLADGFVPYRLESRGWDLETGAQRVQLDAGVSRRFEVRTSEGRPAKEALILYQGLPIALTDVEGVVEFETPIKESFSIGLLARTAKGELEWASLDLAAPGDGASATKEVVPVALQPQTVVTGTVSTRHGGSAPAIPIAGALVHSGGRHAISDREGRYELPVMVAQGYQRWTAIQSTAVGFGATVSGLPSGPVFPGQELDLSMEEAVLLYGQVKGARVAGERSRVAASSPGPSEPVGIPGVLVSVGVRTVLTDDRGWYWIADHDRSSLNWSGIAPEFAPFQQTLEATPDTAERQGLDLTPRGGNSGEETFGNTALRYDVTLDRGSTVVGWVVDQDGQPIPGARALLFRPYQGDRRFFRRSGQRDSLEIAHGSSNSDGRFLLERVPAEVLNLEIAAQGFVTATVPGIEIGELPIEQAQAVVGTTTLVPTRTVQGVVVDRDQQPVVGANVSAVSGSSRDQIVATTDQQGRFQLSGVDANNKSGKLFASATGFLPGTLSLEEFWRSQEPVVIELDPDRSISGRVVDPDGQPVASANIQIESLVGSLGPRQRVESDAEGRFVVPGLWQGRFNLWASHDDYADSLIESVSLGTTPTDERAGEELDEELEKSVVLKLRTGASLTGTVYDPEGGAIAGVRVRVQTGGPWRGGSSTDENGKYRIAGLLPGRHRVVAGYSPIGTDSAAILVSVGDRELQHDFRLKSQIEISGTVLDAGGEPVSAGQLHVVSGSSRLAIGIRGGEFRTEISRHLGDTTLVATVPGTGRAEYGPFQVGESSIEGIELVLEPVATGTIQGLVTGLELDQLAAVSVFAYSPSGDRSSQRHDVTVDYEGRFLIDDVEVGDWEIRATSGPQTITAAVVVVADSEASVQLDFESGASLTGVVYDRGIPLARTTIRLIGLGQLSSQARATSDSAGRFRFERLAPGRYRVEATTTRGALGEEEWTLEGEVERDLELQLATVELEITERTSGEAVADAAAELLDSDTGTSADYNGRADSKGKVHLQRVRPDEYLLSVSAPGYSSKLETIEVRPGESNVFTIGLEPKAGLTLELVGISGQLGGAIGLFQGPSVLATDASGQLVFSGSAVQREPGFFEVDDFPAGNYRVHVFASGSAGAASVSAPGVYRVDLKRVAVLTLEVPALPDSDRAALSIVDTDGKVVYGPWLPPFVGRRGTRVFLPAGAYVITVTLGDGQPISTSVSVRPGEEERLVVE